MDTMHLTNPAMQSSVDQYGERLTVVAVCRVGAVPAARPRGGSPGGEACPALAA